MTERTQSSRSVRRSARLSRFLKTPAGRFVGAVVGVVIVLVIAVGFYLLGRAAGDREVRGTSRTLQFAQNEYDKLATENTRHLAAITDLQLQLKKAKAALSAIMPSENIYNVNPNQSMIVAGGHLTIGLIGSPSNEGVTININGKSHPAAAGDVIHVALDPSTNCEVGVQSFDMFKAVLSAVCATVKP